MKNRIVNIIKYALIVIFWFGFKGVVMASNKPFDHDNLSNQTKERVLNLVESTPYPIIASTSCLRHNYPSIGLDGIHKSNALAYVKDGELISFKVREFTPSDFSANLAVTDPSLKPGPMPKLYGGKQPKTHGVFSEILYKAKDADKMLSGQHSQTSKQLRVAVLISDHSQCVFGRDYLPLIKAFEQNGLTYEEIVWNRKDVDWSQYNGVVIRSTVDYFENPEIYRDFIATIEYIERSRVPLFNNAKTISWNSSKAYLKDLQANGVLIPETKWVKGSELKSTLSSLPADWKDVVIKPVISTGGFKTFRLREHEIKEFAGTDFAQQEGVMVQKTIPEILDEGEWSFVFFNGEYSHTTLKTAAPGEFKVQSFRGGQMSNMNPEAWMIEEAQRILAATKQGNLLYGRVDAIRRGHSLMVMEIELIEPDLYWALNSKAPDQFAAALRLNILDAMKKSSMTSAL